MRFTTALLPLSLWAGCSEDQPAYQLPAEKRAYCPPESICAVPLDASASSSFIVAQSPIYDLQKNEIGQSSYICFWQPTGLNCGDLFLPANSDPASGITLAYRSGRESALITYSLSADPSPLGRQHRQIYLPAIQSYTDEKADTGLPEIFEIENKLLKGDVSKYQSWEIEAQGDDSSGTAAATHDPRLYYLHHITSRSEKISRHPVGRVVLPGTSVDQEITILTYALKKSDGQKGYFHVALDHAGYVITVFPDGQLKYKIRGQKKISLGANVNKDLRATSPKKVSLELVLPNGSRVNLVQPHNTINYNNIFLEIFMQLDKGQPLFPSKMLDGLWGYNILPTDQGYSYSFGAQYRFDQRAIDVAGLRDHSTLMHELIHYWGMSVSKIYLEAKGVNDHYYRLNWSLDYYHAYFPDSIYGKDDWSDFIPWEPDSDRRDRRPYGRSNGTEDMATFGSYYYTDGSQLRQWVREEMKKGNFEPAVKYLFFKAFPFEGQEYNSSYDEALSNAWMAAPLSYNDVDEAITAFQVSSGKVSPRTVASLAAMKDKLIVLETSKMPHLDLTAIKVKTDKGKKPPIYHIKERPRNQYPWWLH